MKIAIASTDGINVNLHFGKANSFYIYNYNEKETKFIEQRTTTITPNQKHQWKKPLELIKDCDTIICTQAGMNSKFGIEQEGIKLIEDSGTIKEVLERYIKHYEFMKKPI